MYIILYDSTSISRIQIKIMQKAWARKTLWHKPVKKNKIYLNLNYLNLQKSRVGHRILFRSERSVLSSSFKERSVLFRSFFEFLVTDETQKNVPFFPVLF